MDFSQAFLTAVDHLMLYEVGGWWNVNTDGAQQGLIDTLAHRHACGYSVDPNDAGGETKYGVAKNANPDIDVTNLVWTDAQTVYWNRYWLAEKCDQLPGRIGALLFDCSVNPGPGVAPKFLQRALGVTADGVIGPATLAAANQADPIALCNSMTQQRTAYYEAVVDAHAEDQEYLAGWLRRVNEMNAFVTDPNGNFGS
jgi:lysozyme family protein